MTRRPRQLDRDHLDPGNDTLHGDFPGSTAKHRRRVRRRGLRRLRRRDAGRRRTRSSARTATRAARPPERITTEGRIQDARSTRYADGGVDTITTEGGDDFALRRRQGRHDRRRRRPENVVFGDHGAITGFVGTSSARSSVSGTLVHEERRHRQLQRRGLQRPAMVILIYGFSAKFTIASIARTAAASRSRARRATARLRGRHDRHAQPSDPGQPGRTAFRPLRDPDADARHLARAARAHEQGGNDTITTGVGRDMVFGGGGNDTIIANSGETRGQPRRQQHRLRRLRLRRLRQARRRRARHRRGLVDRRSRATSTATSAPPRRASAATTRSRPASATTSSWAAPATTRSTAATARTSRSATTCASPPHPMDNPATVYSVHEFTICVIETIGFLDSDSGEDIIYGTPNADILFGGGGNDVIYGWRRQRHRLRRPGQGLVREQHAVRPGQPAERRLRRPRRHARLRRDEHRQDHRLGQRPDLRRRRRRHRLRRAGQRRPLRRGGDDILVGGSNVAGALDNFDTSASASTATSSTAAPATTSIAGDNALCCTRPPATSSTRGCAR